MHTTLRALLRPLALTAHCLCALAFLVLAAPMCAASGTGPVITGAAITPTTLSVVGGVITVTATITDPASRAITGVTALVTLTGSGRFPSGYGTATITLSNGGSGTVYTGNLSSSGTNTTTSSFIYTATITATNDLSLSTTATTTGQTVQTNDETPPIISNAGISPTVLPYTGGVITVFATIADPAGRAITGVTALVTLTGSGRLPNGYVYETIVLSNGGSGTVYTGNLTSNGGNTDPAPYTYTATITATNDLNLTNTATASGQTVQYDSTQTTPQINLTHLLLNRADGAMAVWTLDPAGNIKSSPLYGPIPGWSAHGVAAGPDGLARVLWGRSDGACAVWTLNLDGSIASTPLYGPIPGWAMNAIAVGP